MYFFMAESGRVLHHLTHAASDPRNTILVVGFMAEHTLGVYGLKAEFHQADVLTSELPTADAAFADPGRRASPATLTFILGPDVPYGTSLLGAMCDQPHEDAISIC